MSVVSLSALGFGSGTLQHGQISVLAPVTGDLIFLPLSLVFRIRFVGQRVLDGDIVNFAFCRQFCAQCATSEALSGV